MLPHAVLPALLQQDPARPRVTAYDDTPGDTQGERIELSAKVIANWVAKIGNLLQDELDAQPGTVVALDLPAEHWRTLTWALAVWSVGGVVTDDASTADVVIATQPSEGVDVVVTLPALARKHPEPLPANVIDAAAEVPTFADQFAAYALAGGEADALVTSAGRWRYADVNPAAQGEPRWLVHGDLSQVLRQSLAAWAAGGSVVLCRGTDEETIARRLQTEGATRP